MAVELGIGGFFVIGFTRLDGKDVTRKQEQNIVKELRSGNYIISMNRKVVLDLIDMAEPVYKFNINNSDGVGYDWNEIF